MSVQFRNDLVEDIWTYAEDNDLTYKEARRELVRRGLQALAIDEEAD